MNLAWVGRAFTDYSSSFRFDRDPTNDHAIVTSISHCDYPLIINTLDLVATYSQTFTVRLHLIMHMDIQAVV